MKRFDILNENDNNANQWQHDYRDDGEYVLYAEVCEVVGHCKTKLAERASTLDFWLELRKGISFGTALANCTAEDLDIATENVFRTVQRDVFGKSVDEITAMLRKIAEGRGV